jgi:hypothetical protein
MILLILLISPPPHSNPRHLAETSVLEAECRVSFSLSLSAGMAEARLATTRQLATGLYADRHFAKQVRIRILRHCTLGKRTISPLLLARYRIE